MYVWIYTVKAFERVFTYATYMFLIKEQRADTGKNF